VVRSVVGVWRIVCAGDQRLQRWECSDRQGTSVLDCGNIGERSLQACTAPAEEFQASAVHRGAAVIDLDRTCTEPEIRRAAAFNTSCSSSGFLQSTALHYRRQKSHQRRYT